MTNFLLYGRNDFDFAPADNEDLRRTIYAYYCNKGYPDDLQCNIDNAAHIIAADRSMDEHRIGDMLMTAAGAADIWAFWEGFRACADIMTGFFKGFSYLKTMRRMTNERSGSIKSGNVKSKSM